MDKQTEAFIVAAQLEAIANWQMDSIYQETASGKLLKDGAKLIRKLASRMCGCGIVGCNGGPSCTSDHK